MIFQAAGRNWLLDLVFGLENCILLVEGKVCRSLLVMAEVCSGLVGGEAFVRNLKRNWDRGRGVVDGLGDLEKAREI